MSNAKFTVRPCTAFERDGVRHVEECKPGAAQFWGVYGQVPGYKPAHVADRETRQGALNLARELTQAAREAANASTLCLMESAACLWEEFLERPEYKDANKHVSEGMAGHRSWCVNLTAEAELTWRLARALGFDDSFDWEFCPAFLSRIILKGQALDPVRLAVSIAAEAAR